MKKSNIIITVFSLLMLAGCTTDELAGGKDGQIPVQLCVSQDASASITRTTSDLHTATTGFAVNETMKVFMKNGETTTSKIYKVSSTSGSNPVTATLAPNTASDPLYYPTATSGTVQLYAVFPSGITSGGTHTVAYDQTGDANYRSSDLMYSVATTVNLNDKENQQALNSFAHKMVRLKLNIIKASDVSSVTEVKMVNVKRRVTVSTLNESGMTVGAGTSTEDSNGDNILIFSGTNSETTQQTYYVVFPKQQSSGTNDWDGTNFLTVTADGSTVNYTLTKEFTAGNQYELTLNINAAAIGSTISITGWTDTTSQTIEPTVKSAIRPEAVDLGIEVGGKKILFANMNLGAYDVSDYGLYFMWGDVVGHNGVISSGTTAADGYNFGWASYKWCNGSETTLTKYCNNASYGYNSYTDTKVTLDPEDDAAAVMWGDGWRMPTPAELDALLNTKNTNDFGESNTTHWKWEWQSDYNGSSHAGYLISYRENTGNTTITSTLFLPAAGFRSGTSVRYQGSDGIYWSSSPGSEWMPQCAWYLSISNRYNADVGENSERDWGVSVRAVCEE